MKWFRKERAVEAKLFDSWRVTVHLSSGMRWTVNGATLDRYDSTARRFYSTAADQDETVRLIDGIAGGLRDAGFTVDVETEQRFVSPR